MSRCNYDKPFYVDVGTSIVAVRCASNHDVVLRYDHSWRPSSVELAKTACDRMNKEVETYNSGNAAKLREALELCLRGMCGYCRMDAEARGMTTECVNGCEPMRKAKAALAAPPRNCDMSLVVNGPAYNNAYKAWLVFHYRNPDTYFDVPGLMRCIDWLLAPAKEGDKMKHFDKDEFERSLENYRTGWNDIDDPIAEIRRLRGENEDKNFEPEQQGARNED